MRWMVKSNKTNQLYSIKAILENLFENKNSNQNELSRGKSWSFL